MTTPKKLRSPVLLIGGLAMKGDELNDLAIRLNKLGSFTFLSFDNINVGLGPRLESKAQELSIIHQATHQWTKVNEKLNDTNGKISIFGISMGGMIAATMAYMFPERIDKLILSATSANLHDDPAVPDLLYKKWTEAKTEQELWEAISIAFGKTTFAKQPNIPQNYFGYRISGANGQKAIEFISQLNSVRTFDGEKVYSRIGQSDFLTYILSGSEDVLFDKNHVTGIISKVPAAKHFDL